MDGRYRFFGSGLDTWTTETVEIYLSNDPSQIHELTSRLPHPIEHEILQ
jgi:hypothetical protein